MDNFFLDNTILNLHLFLFGETPLYCILFWFFDIIFTFVVLFFTLLVLQQLKHIFFLFLLQLKKSYRNFREMHLESNDICITPGLSFKPITISLPRVKQKVNGFRKYRVLIYLSCYIDKNSLLYAAAFDETKVSTSVVTAANSAVKIAMTPFSYGYLRHIFVEPINFLLQRMFPYLPGNVEQRVISQVDLCKLFKMPIFGHSYLYDKLFIFPGADKLLYLFDLMRVSGELPIILRSDLQDYFAAKQIKSHEDIIKNTKNYSLVVRHYLLEYTLYVDAGVCSVGALTLQLHEQLLAEVKLQGLTVSCSSFIVCNTVKFKNIFSDRGRVRFIKKYSESSGFY